MGKKYSISELIMNHETPHYNYDEELKRFKEVRKVQTRNGIRALHWVDEKHIKSIATPEGRELTPEELFDFVIGYNITDFAKAKDKNANLADIAIVLGNSELLTTRQRAIKAFELYKLKIVKKIIFTGGMVNGRDVKFYMHPTSLDDYKCNDVINQTWSDLPEADWGAQTFVPYVFDRNNYTEHKIQLTEKFLKSINVNPEDILTESMSTTTQENAEFCKNIFEAEELETGMQIKSAILVTTCTHGNRAMMQFKKAFDNKISLKWCPSTLDLEKYQSLKNLLNNPDFNEVVFRAELKRIYCTTPELIQMLRTETANYRNVFIRGEIDEPSITLQDREVNCPLEL